MEVISVEPSMSTFSFRKEDLELGEDFFVWPHPMDSDKALFVVDGVAKRTVREAVSQSHEGVRETLFKLGDAVIMVARLGTEAQR